jgi:hypothetical protein
MNVREPMQRALPLPLRSRRRVFIEHPDLMDRRPDPSFTAFIEKAGDFRNISRGKI